MNNTNKQMPLQHLHRRTKELGIDRYPQVAMYLFHLQANPADNTLLALLQESVEQAEQLNISAPNPFRATNPITPLINQGNIGLGYVTTSELPWTTTTDILTNHLLIAGRSGGGKTNLILLIIAQLLGIQHV